MERHGLFKVTKPPVVVSSGKMSDDAVVSEALLQERARKILHSMSCCSTDVLGVEMDSLVDSRIGWKIIHSHTGIFSSGVY